jgi:ribosomal protein S18 acetylase RimI-like enzyme
MTVREQRSVVQLRPLAESDFPAVAARVDEWWGRPVRGALLRLFFEHFLPMSHAAEKGGVLVGFIVGFQSQTHPRVAYAHFVAVAPEARRHGLGRTLYEAFFESARARGCTSVEAITAPINTRSITFHQSLGFELVASDTVVDGFPVSFEHEGPGQHRVRLRRTL